MAAPAAQTVTYLVAAGQTIGQIQAQVRNRLAGQTQGVQQLGAIKDSSGNIYDVQYDPVANIFISANTLVA